MMLHCQVKSKQTKAKQHIGVRIHDGSEILVHVRGILPSCCQADAGDATRWRLAKQSMHGNSSQARSWLELKSVLRQSAEQLKSDVYTLASHIKPMLQRSCGPPPASLRIVAVRVKEVS